MPDLNKNDIINWVKKLNHFCINLNNYLIKFYELDRNELLSDYDFFELPLVAAKHKIIPRQAEIIYDFDNKKNLNYHIHGTGITFFLEEVKIFFEYYPKTSPERKPILGLIKVFDFIFSSNPDENLCTLQEIQDYLILLFQDKTLIRIDENYFEFYLNE